MGNAVALVVTIFDCMSVMDVLANLAEEVFSEVTSFSGAMDVGAARQNAEVAKKVSLILAIVDAGLRDGVEAGMSDGVAVYMAFGSRAHRRFDMLPQSFDALLEGIADLVLVTLGNSWTVHFVVRFGLHLSLFAKFL